VIAALLTAALLLVSGVTHAKATLEVASVDVAQKVTLTKERDRRLKLAVRRLAAQSAKHLDFGKQGKVQVTILIKELTIEESDDVVRVTCTLVGKLEGGGSAKSRISFGGKPDKKKKLEKQVLGSVTDGVMTRLAELARAKEKAKAGS
jgi:hypothetical protein